MKKSGMLLACGLTALAFAAGCGKSNDGGGTITPNVKIATQTATAATESFFDLAGRLFVGPGSTSSLTTGSAVSSANSGLTSMKYFITSIQICQSMTTTGTAFSNQSGCLELYKGPSDSTLNSGTPVQPSQIDYVSLANYARTSTTGYIDLMSTTDRQKLATAYTMKSADAGTYKYGLVNWAYPVKVTATVSDTSGNAILYTHDGTTTLRNTDSNGDKFYSAVSSTALTSSPAQEAVVVMPNGGSWFKFQNPFVISADDTSNATYTLDLTFNPDGIITGVKGGGNAAGSEIVDGSVSSPTNSIHVPMLDLSPVPRKSTDTTVKESYTCTNSSASWTQDLRLELYYLKSDSTKTIYGASVASIVNANSTGNELPFSKVAAITTASDSTLSFNDWGGTAIISGFTRQSTAGHTTTATVCTSWSTSGSTTSCSATMSATCTLNSVASLQ